jgi:ferrous iron transport protein A
MMRLDQLSIGDCRRVRAVHGFDEIAMRLMEMGLTPGVDCRLIGVAPLGDPLELEVRGYRLSLRRSEASRVEVEVS